MCRRRSSRAQQSPARPAPTMMTGSVWVCGVVAGCVPGCRVLMSRAFAGSEMKADTCYSAVPGRLFECGAAGIPGDWKAG